MISTPYRLECIEYLEALIYIGIGIYIAGFISSERHVNRTVLDKLSNPIPSMILYLYINVNCHVW